MHCNNRGWIVTGVALGALALLAWPRAWGEEATETQKAKPKEDEADRGVVKILKGKAGEDELRLLEEESGVKIPGIIKDAAPAEFLEPGGPWAGVDFKALKVTIVVEVKEGSPAAKAGLKKDDVVLSVDGQTEKIKTMVPQRKPGDRLKLLVWREGKLVETSLVLGAIPEGAGDLTFSLSGPGQEKPTTNVIKGLTRGNPIVGTEGVTLEPQSFKMTGLLDVKEGSPAAKAGLKKGDVIVTVDGQSGKLQVMLQKYKPGDQVKLLILREGKLVESSLVLGTVPEGAGGK